MIRALFQAKEDALDRFVTDEDRKEVEKAVTFEELRAVAARILQRMPQPVGMVCGPITTGGTGSVQKNLTILRRAIQALEKEGQHIFDQTFFETPMFRIKETPYCRGDLHLLETFYLPLFEAGLIKALHFLPAWSSSDGATWEHGAGFRLGLEIKYL